jgi:hypothetical protein
METRELDNGRSFDGVPSVSMDLRRRPEPTKQASAINLEFHRQRQKLKLKIWKRKKKGKDKGLKKQDLEAFSVRFSVLTYIYASHFFTLNV